MSESSICLLLRLTRVDTEPLLRGPMPLTSIRRTLKQRAAFITLFAQPEIEPLALFGPFPDRVVGQAIDEERRHSIRAVFGRLVGVIPRPALLLRVGRSRPSYVHARATRTVNAHLAPGRVTGLLE